MEKKKLFFSGIAGRNRRGDAEIIYALCDPRDGNVRYVGITNNLLGRLNEHMRMYGGNERKNVWLKELIDDYLLPIVLTLEVLADETEWREREIAWIKTYIDVGVDLLNDEAYKYQSATEAEGA
jgi:hypothetical protein